MGVCGEAHRAPLSERNRTPNGIFCLQVAHASNAGHLAVPARGIGWAGLQVPLCTFNIDTASRADFRSASVGCDLGIGWGRQAQGKKSYLSAWKRFGLFEVARGYKPVRAWIRRWACVWSVTGTIVMGSLGHITRHWVHGMYRAAESPDVAERQGNFICKISRVRLYRTDTVLNTRPLTKNSRTLVFAGGILSRGIRVYDSWK